MRLRSVVGFIGLLGLSASCVVAGQTPRLVDVGLKELNKYRPAISIHYYSGHPAYYAQGQGVEWDLHRIGSYLDAISQDVGGLWLIGQKNAEDLIATHAGASVSARQFGLGQYTHVHGGVPGAFLEKVNWYGLSREMSRADPKLMCAIADPRYYDQVIDRYAKEVLGGMARDQQPSLWYLESEPGINYVDYLRLRRTDRPEVVRLWQQFLADMFGDIAKLNEAGGTAYTSFSQVSLHEDHWLVRVMVARFSSWLLYVNYQGQQVEAFRQHAKGTPIATRWCEMSAAALDPRDFSRLDQVDVDYAGFTWYPGNPWVPYNAKNRSLLGKATSNFSMIRFYGKPISSGELGYWPTGSAFCMFFGATPASSGDEIRAASAVNILGKMQGDLSKLWDVASGEEVLIEAI